MNFFMHFGLEMKEVIHSNWRKSFIEEDIRVSFQIQELINMRDSLEAWLTKNECQEIINFLSTM